MEAGNYQPKQDLEEEFKRELQQLLNRHSIDSFLNTPDYVIADFLFDALEALDRLGKARHSFFNSALEDLPGFLNSGTRFKINKEDL